MFKSADRALCGFFQGCGWEVSSDPEKRGGRLWEVQYERPSMAVEKKKKKSQTEIELL